MTPIFAGKVDGGGRLVLDAPLAYRAHLGKLRDRRVEVVVRPFRSQRTQQQSRYYFGVVVPLIAEYCGYDKQEAHEVLAMRFLRIDDCPITGAPRRKRTPDCDTAEFSEYVNSCIRLAAEHGIRVPEPHEVEA